MALLASLWGPTGAGALGLRLGEEAVVEVTGLRNPCVQIDRFQDGLMKRLTATGLSKVVIGISGGLDSTQAALVAVRAFDRLGLPPPAPASRMKQLPLGSRRLWRRALSAKFRHGVPSGPLHP